LIDSLPVLRFLIAGQLRRDYILSNSGNAYLDIPGGNVLYAAAGLGVWEEDIGLISRVGENYPPEWLSLISTFKIDPRGIRILPESIDLRSFVAYTDQDIRHFDTPISHFARLGLEYPKSLLGFVNPPPQLDSRSLPTLLTCRSNDFPKDYLDATAVHLCPLDFLSHTLLPSAFRQGHISTVTIDPGHGYMNPAFWDDIPSVLQGVNVFHTSDTKILNLFLGRSTDLWEMAETLGDLGCEIIVIKRGLRGQMLYIHSNHTKWMIPAYPSRSSDPTGAGSAFCGGFLAGYRRTYDPLEAVLYGNISASLVIEGNGPFYALDTLPGLAAARLEALRGMPRRN
jgi:hypothetical protein